MMSNKTYGALQQYCTDYTTCRNVSEKWVENLMKRRKYGENRHHDQVGLTNQGTGA